MIDGAENKGSAGFTTCGMLLMLAGSVLLKNKKTSVHHGAPKVLPLDAAQLKKVLLCPLNIALLTLRSEY